MAESSTISNQSSSLSHPTDQRPSNNRNNNRRQNQRRSEISSQDVRYNQNSQQRPQLSASQRQQYQQQMYSYYPYENDYYYDPSYANNYYYNQPRQQRRPQPRQPVAASQPVHQRRNRPASQTSTSTNDSQDLRSTLTQQLLENKYECMICIMKIQREQSIWSCEVCYKMFHLNCIQTWARSEESGADKNWRCPGCQYSYAATPMYNCFCNKRQNPIYSPSDIPHSCGERCGKRLNKKSTDCRHECPELCHPGPCPPCTTMSKRSCLCGKESRTVMCSSTTIIRCENKCGKLKSCRSHYCEAICHPRECGTCDVLVEQHCASHGTHRSVVCSSETGDQKTYTCGSVCGKLLACGHHTCEKMCHDGPCPSCSLLPENCHTCACGKTRIDNEQRTSCLDPLLTCEELCGKVLTCGPINNHHLCLALCHTGPCPSCEKESTLQCRCGQLTKSTSCTEAIQYDPFKNPFCCDRRCNKKKLCGKHRCNELCCNRDIHLCEMVCGKMLNCGQHQCEDLCHKNACRKCPIVSYDELSCRCGQTILQPPVPCGTPLPSCNYRCDREHACDHPVYHSCHNDEVCPPCAHLVEKLCVGGHVIRNNVQCFLQEVSCGQPCGKALGCGVHTCQRPCHGGACQTTGQKCLQKCTIKRNGCGHPCGAPCHSHDPCPLTTCHEIMTARCSCGRLEEKIFCNTKPKGTTEHKDETDLTQSLVQALSVRTIDLALTRKQQGTVPPQIECDDECRRIQRNKKLAEALSINPDEARTTTVTYTDFLMDYAKKNSELVQSVERDFAQLIDDTRRLNAAKRCHSFKPMKKNERHVIHELASFYGLETQAMDPEPHRSVTVYAIAGLCKIPPVLLTEIVRREKRLVPPPVGSV